MGITLKNNVKTILSAGISSTDTTIPVADTSVFPALGASDYFYCTIESRTGSFEIVKVTQINSTTLTVVRAQESTIAVPFLLGSRVELRVTVGNLDDRITQQVETGDFDVSLLTVTPTGATTARTLAAMTADHLSVKDFGAKGDGRIYKGVSITIGTNTLVSAGAAFTAEDVGKDIWVQLASNGTAPLKTTVTGYTNATTVTLAANAGATINNSTRIVKIGTDDTAAIDAAVAASRSIFFPRGTYLYSDPDGIVLGNGSAAAPSTTLNYSLIGECGSTYDLLTNTVQQGTGIEYFGSTLGTYMLDAQVTNVTIHNLTFNATYRVSTIWNLKHVFWSDVNMCGLLYPAGGGTGLRLGAYNNAAGIFVGAGGNVFHQLYITCAGANDCVALQVGEDAYSTGFDPATTRFDNCYFAVSDDTTATSWTAFNRVPTSNTSTCVLLRFTDNISFDGCFCYVSGERRGNGVLVKPPSGSYPASVFPCQIRMSGCHQVGGIWVDNTDNTWDPDAGDGVVRGLLLVCAHYGDASDPNYDGAAYPPNIPGITGFTDAGEMFGAWAVLDELRQTDPEAFGLALLEVADAAGLRTAGGLSANGSSLVTAADYAAMRVLLGLVVGTDVQAYDADLATWAGVTSSANGRSLVSAADYAAMRALLDLEAGTDFLSPAAIAAAYQPLAANLTTWAGVSPSSNGQSLVSAADYAAMRVLLGVPRVVHSAVAVPLTGSVAETVMATIAIGAGELGPNGFVEIDKAFSCTNDASTKTIRTRIGASGAGTGGTLMDSGTPTSVAAQRRLPAIHNRNSASSQVCTGTGAAGSTGSTNAPSTAAINTANASEVVITGQLADSADTLTLEHYTVKIYYGA